MKNDRRRKEVMSAVERKRIEAKETKEMDAVRGGVTQKTASGAPSSKAEIGAFGESLLASTVRARWR